jgi:hypothetical protein
LACIASTQHPQVKGACRSVKFSPSPSIDLLAFTEHVSYVNIVDARTFDGKQSIRVAPPGSDVHVSGISWSPDSRGIFVGMFIYDAILWSQKSVIIRFHTSDSICTVLRIHVCILKSKSELIE